MHTKLGRLLQLERERLELDLDDISEELKISAANLEAIETGDISALPGEMYFGLFAKSYAERLGIDYSRTVEAIEADIDEAGANGGSKSKEREKRDDDDGVEVFDESSLEETETSLFGRGLIRLVILTVVAFAAFLTVYFVWFDSPDLMQSGSDNETGQEAVVDTQGDSSAMWADYDWNVPEFAEPPKMQLWLQAREESWATIVADGDTIIYRTLTPWREFTVEAQYRLRISVGIPSRVSIKLNGQEVDLVDPESRRISRVEINQANISSFLETAEVEVEQSEPSPPSGQPESTDLATDDSSGVI